MQQLSIGQIQRLDRYLSDQRLKQFVRDACLGDDAAFRSLFDHTHRQLIGAVRKFGCLDHVEDVLNETYLQAWRTIETFEPERCSVVGWLVVIARSRALDRWRREASGRSVSAHSSDFDPDLLTHAGPGPDEVLITKQQWKRLAPAWDSLEPRDRSVLSLAHFQDFSHSEIAVATGMPLGTVKTILLRAHRKMRSCLELSGQFTS